MKRVVLPMTFLCLSFAIDSYAQTSIFSSDIIFYSPYQLADTALVGKEVITYGKVKEVKPYTTPDNIPVFFINLEKRFPENPSALIVFQNNYSGNFNQLKYLKGKTILASGILELKREYRQDDIELKPTITISSPKQIKMVTDWE